MQRYVLVISHWSLVSNTKFFSNNFQYKIELLFPRKRSVIQNDGVICFYKRTDFSRGIGVIASPDVLFHFLERNFNSLSSKLILPAFGTNIMYSDHEYFQVGYCRNRCAYF